MSAPTFELPDPLAVDQGLVDLIERYRSACLDFFLARFDAAATGSRRGGFFDVNSVTGRPYNHHLCYTWGDGRALGEFCAAHLAGLRHGDPLEAYIEHLYDVLVERWDRNGYFPHAVGEATNLAEGHPWNVPLGPGQSSFSHIFALNGLLQYALLRGSEPAWQRGLDLLDDLAAALRDDRFLEGAAAC